MAHSNPNEGYGPPPAVSFGSDSMTPRRGFIWDPANLLKPIIPTSATQVDGVSTADGKAGVLACPGSPVQIDCFCGPGSVSVVAGNSYNFDTSTGAVAGGSAGTTVKALQGLGGTNQILLGWFSFR